MICPILSIGTLVRGNSHIGCAKEECEWWNPLIKGCDPTNKFSNKLGPNEYVVNRGKTHMTLSEDGATYRDNE